MLQFINEFFSVSVSVPVPDFKFNSNKQTEETRLAWHKSVVACLILQESPCGEINFQQFMTAVELRWVGVGVGTVRAG